ncbi:MAG: hypothetical protein IJ058_04030 [Lachnospiraceae bacterium]|nr:hypothetical protein [Lachnospiraceae bacterium]
MLLLIESLIGIALFTLIVIPVDLKDPIAVIGDYPHAIGTLIGLPACAIVGLAVLIA